MLLPFLITTSRVEVNRYVLAHRFHAMISRIFPSVTVPNSLSTPMATEGNTLLSNVYSGSNPNLLTHTSNSFQVLWLVNFIGMPLSVPTSNTTPASLSALLLFERWLAQRVKLKYESWPGLDNWLLISRMICREDQDAMKYCQASLDYPAHIQNYINLPPWSPENGQGSSWPVRSLIMASISSGYSGAAADRYGSNNQHPPSFLYEFLLGVWNGLLTFNLFCGLHPRLQDFFIGISSWSMSLIMFTPAFTNCWTLLVHRRHHSHPIEKLVPG